MTDRIDWATREDVREMSRDILAQIDRRFDDQQNVVDQRHHENVGSLRLIVDETRKADSRLTTLEQIVKTLGEEFQAVRKRWHDFRDSFQKSALILSSDEKLLTRKELGWIIALIVGSIAIGATVTIWVLSVKGGP